MHVRVQEIGNGFGRLGVLGELLLPGFCDTADEVISLSLRLPDSYE